MLIDRYLHGLPHVTKIHHRYQALYRFQEANVHNT